MVDSLDRMTMMMMMMMIIIILMTNKWFLFRWTLPVSRVNSLLVTFCPDLRNALKFIIGLFKKVINIHNRRCVEGRWHSFYTWTWHWTDLTIWSMLHLNCIALLSGVFLLFCPPHLHQYHEAKFNNKHLSAICNTVQQRHNPQHPRCSLNWTGNHPLSSHYYIMM